MNAGETDVAIVGAGPIGIELAVALKKTGISAIHFDAGQVGQTISWFAPGTKFFSSNERIAIAGVPLQTADQSKATREEYLAYLRSVVLQYDLQINCYEPIVGIDRTANGFTLHTRHGAGGRQGIERTYRTRRIVLATGGTDRPRKLDIPGEDLSHVSHYFADPHTYFRQRLLVVGGKNSAVEAALRCYQVGAKVSVSYRRNALPDRSIKYWLMPEIAGLMQAGRIGSHFSTVPTKITPESVWLQSVDEALRPVGEPYEVSADFVLLLIGYEQDQSLFKMAGIDLVDLEQRPVYDEQTMETNVPGIYVAGTAIGGTQQRYSVFLENCHVHCDRIVSALQGRRSRAEVPSFASPES